MKSGIGNWPHYLLGGQVMNDIPFNGETKKLQMFIQLGPNGILSTFGSEIRNK